MSSGKLYHGKQCGMSDGAPSENYSDWQISRAVDLINAAVKVQFDFDSDDGRDLYDEVVKLLPAKLRFAITWSRWTYVDVDRR